MKKPKIAKKFVEHSDGSASDSALFKEELPRKVSVGDVWMNLHQAPPEHGRQLEAADVETQGDQDTLMGRLAMRMASRDMIDELNLGPKGNTPTAKQAQVADNDLPKKVRIEGPANFQKAIKIESEHKDTIDALKKNPKLENKEAYKKIATDHIKEHPDYYDEKKGLPAMEKRLQGSARKAEATVKDRISTADMLNEVPSKMFLGAGLHEQTKDVKASNMSDPIPTEKVRKGANMAEQAKNARNVFDTMLDRDIEQQKSLPKLFKK